MASSIAVDGDPPREFPDEPYEYNSSNVFTADLLLSALWQDAVVSSDAARAMETMVSRAIIGRDIAQFAGVDMRSLDLLFLSPAIMARTDALSLIRQDARTVREMAELLRRIAKTLRSFPLLVQTEREFLSRASAEVAAHLSERQIHTLETECAQRLAALSELEEASGGAPTLESLATALSSVPVSEPTSMIAIDLPQEYAERLRQAELCDVLAELLRADQNLNEVKPASGESSTIGTLAVSFDSLRSSYLVLPLGREGTRSASGPFEVLCVE